MRSFFLDERDSDADLFPPQPVHAAAARELIHGARLGKYMQLEGMPEAQDHPASGAYWQPEAVAARHGLTMEQLLLAVAAYLPYEHAVAAWVQRHMAELPQLLAAGFAEEA